MEDKNVSAGDKEITVEKLQEQLENLNKGIAKYRDDARNSSNEAAAARAEAKAAKAEADSIRAAIEASKDPDEDEEKVKLSLSDQKRLEVWAKSQGFVTQKEMEQERARKFNDSIKNIESQAVEEYLKKYPEVNNDEEWTKIKTQFELYRQPTTLTGYRQILDKVHKELYGSDDKTAQARAKIEERKRLSLGGGSQKQDSDESKIEAMQEKYPNLSREQIENRLSEINDLADARAKRNKGKK